MRTALLIGGMMLAGCMGGGPDQPDAKPAAAPPPAPPSTQGADEMWIPDQGVHILGSGPDVLGSGPGYISVSPVPAFRTRFTLSLSAAVDGAHLTATDGTTTYSKDDAWFTNLILTASDRGQIKITGAAPIAAADLEYLTGPTTVPDTEYVANAVASTEYTLLYRKAKVGGGYEDWQPYCGADGGAAVPVAGHYGAKRDHAPGGISFACHNGIAFKCTMWGFPTGPGRATDQDAWDLHSACTGMGNARYCGDAQSFTREMTPIWIIDQQPGRGVDQNASELMHPGQRGDPWPGNPDVFYIEAGWKRDGTPLCLSKLRWVSLPPDPCGGVVLQDPRQVPSDGHEVFFCDGLSVTDLFNLGAVLVNGSPMLDAPLGRWENSHGDKVSTIRGVWIDADHDGRPDADSVFPFPDANGSSDYRRFDGYDGMLLRNLTGTLAETDMMQLYMPNLGPGGDHFISNTGPGRSSPSFEGYSFLHQTTVDNEQETIVGTPFNQCQWSRTDTDTHLGSSSIGCVQNPATPLGFAFEAP